MASGEVEGTAMISLTPWSALTGRSVTLTIPEVCSSAATSFVSAAWSAAPWVCTAICSGPLNPGPNPSESRS